MNINTEELSQRAKKLRKEFIQYYKKNKKFIEKNDLLIHQIHRQVSESIDCLACANCCKTLGPAIYDKDIEKMSKALKIKPSQFVETYLKKDEDGDYVFKSMPCPFLMADNYCAIYEHRPKACREYPHTDRKKFVQIYKLTVENSQTCPIALQVLEKIISFPR